MKFSDIPGHDDVKQRLREIVDNNRMPHALLLEGPEGSAKFALARALAQYIHCTNRQNGDSCGVCPSCRQHASFRHIDTIYSFPVTKKNSKATISDDYLPEFQELLNESPWMDFETWLVKLQSPNTLPQLFVEEGNALLRRLSYTAHASKYKIVLMWQPERMKEEMANKMLKLVEEPHADTLFIMASDNSRQILPTIYSRVQRVPVKRYDNNTVAQWLTTQGVSDVQAAADAAVLAEGSLNKALRMLDSKSESSQHLEWFMQLMRLAYQRKIADLKQWAQTVGAEKREMLIHFLDYCCRMLRENFISNFHNPQFNIMTEAESKFSVNFARFINERNVLRLFDAFSEASRDVAANGNGKIVMFDLAITVILLLKN